MSVTRADREASLKKRYAGRVAAAPKRRGMGRGPGAPRGGGRPKSTGAALKRLLSYLEADRLRMGIAFFCVIVNTVATLTGSYMLRPIINRFIAPPDGSPGNVAGLFKGLTMMACVYLLGVIANYLQSRLMLEVAQSALVRIRTDLFTKMQKLPVRFYDTNSNGDLMSRFTNDVDTIGNMLSSTLVQLFSGTLSIIGTLCLMLYTNIWLTAVTLIMIPLMLRAGGEVAKRSQKYFSAQQSALGALNGYIEETITGQKVVKVFCHEEIAEEEFDILNRDLREKQIRAQFLGGMMGPVMNNLSQINYSLTACIGGILCVVKNFDVGGLTVFLNFSRQFSRPINEISMQVSNVFSALAGAERVFSVMDEEPEAADDKDAVSMDGMSGEVVLDHVTFGYNPDKIILKDISLYARPGQKIAFVGSTGAGKTTITNLINRFYDIQSGTITIDGVDICHIKRDELRRHIAMVLQDTHLFTGTVMENIRYGRLDATDEEVAEIRSREISVEGAAVGDLSLQTIAYQTATTEERFLEWITPENKIAGFCRLSLPTALPRDTASESSPPPIKSEQSEARGSSLASPSAPQEAMIREVHVYGKVAALHRTGEGTQHLGLGRALVEEACAQATAAGYTAINVISAVGTRVYYRNLGFKDAGLYQKRPLP